MAPALWVVGNGCELSVQVACRWITCQDEVLGVGTGTQKSPEEEAPRLGRRRQRSLTQQPASTDLMPSRP